MEAQILSTFLWAYITGSAICLTFSLIVRHIIKAHDLEDKKTTLFLTMSSWLGVAVIIYAFFSVFFKNNENENEN